MKWKELKQKVESLDVNDIDEYEIDIFGQNSLGSFGSVDIIQTLINNTPDGEYKELVFTIKA